MKAAVRDRYGPPDVVSVRDVETPIPTGDQVLVRMQAASVNRADLDLIYPKPGFARLFLGMRAPRDQRLGCDIAGIVEAVGPAVTRFRQGDAVFADLYPFGLGALMTPLPVHSFRLGSPTGLEFMETHPPCPSE